MLQRYGLGWWAIQLPAVMPIIGSPLFRDFEQQVSILCLADLQHARASRLWLERP